MIPENNGKTPQTHCIIIIAGAVTPFPGSSDDDNNDGAFVVSVYCTDDSMTLRFFVGILS